MAERKRIADKTLIDHVATVACEEEDGETYCLVNSGMDEPVVEERFENVAAVQMERFATVEDAIRGVAFDPDGSTPMAMKSMNHLQNFQLELDEGQVGCAFDHDSRILECMSRRAFEQVEDREIEKKIKRKY